MFELKWPINPISIVGNFKDLGNSPGLESKKRGGGPVYLTKVFETWDSISIISQEGKVSRKSTCRNPENSTPVFGDRLVPHRVTRRRSNGRAKIRVRFDDLKISTFRNMNDQPLPIFSFVSLKCLKPVGIMAHFLKLKAKSAKSSVF